MSTATFNTIRRKFNFSIHEELFFDEQEVVADVDSQGEEEDFFDEEELSLPLQEEEEDLFMEFTHTISFVDGDEEEEDRCSSVSGMSTAASSCCTSEKHQLTTTSPSVPPSAPSPSFSFNYPVISKFANDIIVDNLKETLLLSSQQQKKPMTKLQVILEPSMESVSVPREWMCSSWSMRSRGILRQILNEGLNDEKYSSVSQQAFYSEPKSTEFLFWVLQTLVGRKPEGKHLAKPNLYWTERRFLDALVDEGYPAASTDSTEDKQALISEKRRVFRVCLEKLLGAAQDLGREEVPAADDHDTTAQHESKVEEAGMMRRAEVLLALHIIYAQGSEEQKEDFRDLLVLKLGGKRTVKKFFCSLTQAIIDICTRAVDVLRLAQEKKEDAFDESSAQGEEELLVKAQTRLSIMFQRFLDDHKHGAFDTAFLTATHFASALSDTFPSSDLLEISETSRRWWNLAIVEGFGGKKWLELPLLLQKPSFLLTHDAGYAHFVWKEFSEDERAALLRPESFATCYSSIPELAQAVETRKSRRSFEQAQVLGFGRRDLVTTLRDGSGSLVEEKAITGWSHNISAFAEMFREDFFAVRCFKTMSEEEENYPGFKDYCRRLFPHYSCCSAASANDRFQRLVSSPETEEEEISSFLRWLGFLKPQEDISLHKISQMERGARQSLAEEENMLWAEFECCLGQSKALEANRNNLIKLEHYGRDSIAAEGVSLLNHLLCLIKRGPIPTHSSHSLSALLVDQCPEEEKKRIEERRAELRRKRQKDTEPQQQAKVEETATSSSVWSRPPTIPRQSQEEEEDDDWGLAGLF